MIYTYLVTVSLCLKLPIVLLTMGGESEFVVLSVVAKGFRIPGSRRQVTPVNSLGHRREFSTISAVATRVMSLNSGHFTLP